MLVYHLAVHLLRIKLKRPNGVGLCLQPLNNILYEKTNNKPPINTAYLTMSGEAVREGNATLSHSLDEIVSGDFGCLLGHAESFLSTKGKIQNLITNLSIVNLKYRVVKTQVKIRVKCKESQKFALAVAQKVKFLKTTLFQALHSTKTKFWKKKNTIRTQSQSQNQKPRMKRKIKAETKTKQRPRTKNMTKNKTRNTNTDRDTDTDADTDMDTDTETDKDRHRHIMDTDIDTDTDTDTDTPT